MTHLNSSFPTQFSVLISDYPELSPLSGGGFRLRSPAKINLALQVLGKRADGYHELDTLFQEIDWWDDLDFYPASAWRFTVDGPQELLTDSNLIVRAAACLSKASGKPMTGHVHLTKRLPLGGGLGGGSSNGTTALFGLSRLWGLDLPLDQLEPLASSLGSDTTFFLHGGLARGQGRGERITPLESALSSPILLISPHFSISTSWAFETAQFPLTDSGKSVIFQFRINPRPNSNRWIEGLFNDLENIVLPRYPELARLKHDLLGAGARNALLSGSGSSFYGIFEDAESAERAARGLSSAYDWRICRGVARR